MLLIGGVCQFKTYIQRGSSPHMKLLIISIALIVKSNRLASVQQRSYSWF